MKRVRELIVEGGQGDASASLGSLLDAALDSAKRQLLEAAGDLLEGQKVQTTFAALDRHVASASLKVTGPRGVQYIVLYAIVPDRNAKVTIYDEQWEAIKTQVVAYNQLTAKRIVEVWKENTKEVER